MDIGSALRAINARHRGHWRLVESLAHGFNQGAFRVRDDDGRHAVLKMGDGPWMRGLRRVAPVLRRARARGWPAPAFLAFGRFGERSYLLREWIDGKTVLEAGCNGSAMDAILAGVELQAGIGPRGRRDWSEYTREVLFDAEWGGREVLRGHSAATARLVDEVGRLTKALGHHKLPNSDLVHGDFSFANIVIRPDRRVAFLDMEQAGRGTRAYDLAVLLMVASWDSLSLAVPLQKRLLKQATAIACPEVLLICSASVSLDWARFGLTHWPTEDLDRFARRRVDELIALGARV